jgi:hypothetical protein
LESRHCLGQELDLLTAQLRDIEEEAGEVAARLCHVLDPARLHRIGLEIDPYDRDRAGGVSRCAEGLRTRGVEHVDLESQQLVDERREPLEPPLGESVLHDDVLADCVAQLTQPMIEGIDVYRPSR